MASPHLNRSTGSWDPSGLATNISLRALTWGVVVLISVAWAGSAETLMYGVGEARADVDESAMAQETISSLLLSCASKGMSTLDAAVTVSA